MFNNNKILITGGAGYIGSHTAVELLNAGYEVLVLDDLSNSSQSVLEQIFKITGKKPQFVHVDLTDEEKVIQIVRCHPEITKVIHFAAFKAVEESVKEPLKYYRNNFYSLLNLLSAFKDRAFNLVFSSSCTVYGEPDRVPVNELAEIKRAESPYGNTKRVCEEILKDISLADINCKVISLRYFNPVGAHSSAFIGELPKGIPQNLVPFITQSAAGKRGPLTVFGSDYDTPDGSCMRDFIHVVDLAKAHVAAIKKMDSRLSENYSVYNIGTGQAYSVLEAISVFEQVSGVSLKYTIGPRRKGDIVKIWGDVEKASNELGWKATFSLQQMMASAWAWEQRQ